MLAGAIEWGYFVDAILTFLLGIGVAVAGYFLKRWWEGQPTKESIQETVQLASLHREMKSGNFTFDALAALKNQIKSRAASSVRFQTEIFEGIERAATEKEAARAVEYEPYSQQDMNQYAFHLADLAERELEFVTRSLKDRLSESERSAFDAAQKAWKKFAQKQSEFESLEMEGGTAQPLLHASALRLMTVERAAEVKEELNRRVKAEFGDS